MSAGIPILVCIDSRCNKPTIEDSQACAQHTAEAIYGVGGQG